MAKAKKSKKAKSKGSALKSNKKPKVCEFC